MMFIVLRLGSVDAVHIF